MNSQEFLNEVFILNKKIDAKQREIDILNALLKKTGYELTPDKVQSSKRDTFTETICKLIDAKDELNKMIDEYVDKLAVVRNVIELVKDPKEYELLHKHYIQGLNWTQIAVEWDNSNTWVHEVKRSAFDSVQKILDKKAI